MLRNLLRTPDDRVIAFLRVALAIVVWPHGAQKMLGWFGGFGPSGTLGFLTQQMHIPAPIAMLVFVGEFFAPMALFFGFLGRLSALAIAIDFTVVLLKVHIHNGFFMNWGGQQKGEGSEFFILVIAMAIALVVRGSGAWSIDRTLVRETAPPRAV